MLNICVFFSYVECSRVCKCICSISELFYILFYLSTQFVDRVARGLEIQQFGDGSTSRDYTYIDDIVDGVVYDIREKK